MMLRELKETLFLLCDVKHKLPETYVIGLFNEDNPLSVRLRYVSQIQGCIYLLFSFDLLDKSDFLDLDSALSIFDLALRRASAVSIFESFDERE